ncbi:helix-turn-helix transcriptional regulator [Desulforhopalus singaporensis]|uniref:Transcriptional regulator, AlpA family n=1 Tax=Desulforhopalus singaporensis TaxID=91360 RepID=A0A1H0TUD0_9BACT|nr:transcriptional regulator, AlpA family [Desulforhopalus singaporensis]
MDPCVLNLELLRLRGVEQKTGCKKSKIYQLMKEGSFPLPLKLGSRCVAWRSDEVDDWINNLPRSKCSNENQ